MKFAKTRRNSRNRKLSQKRRRTAARRSRRNYRRKQRGGNFSFVVPDSAVVRWRSLDDEGTQPPVFLLKSDADKAEEEMEHLVS